VEDGLAVLAEAAGAVGHQALALGGADGLAQVGLARQAELALAAFRRVAGSRGRRRDRGDAFADGLDDAAALMAEDGREDAFRSAPERV
jgi:ornithine cyclodeaminase/alanine dehydrogenase-like protein (mu-crystallin family)